MKEEIIGTDETAEVPAKEIVVKKKVVRKKKKAATKKKVVAKKRAAPKKKAKKAAKKTAKRRGRPPTKKKVRKTAKKRGRPPVKKAGRKKRTRRVAAKPKLVNLPITAQTNIQFWSKLVSFLNDNKNKSLFIHLDGKNFSLGAD